MAKKSRRARREETQKQPKATIAPPPVITVAESAELPVLAPTTTPKVVTTQENQRKTLDFAQEYFHVYFDVRNVVLIGALLFAVLIALAFVI
jgi:methionyl-tRNA formyltransferase